MDSFLQAIAKGILQGLTEFLPISSSAHLLIFPWLLGWQPSDLLFDVILHGGTLGALVVYFWSYLRQFIRDIVNGFRDKSEGTLLTPVAVGTVPTVVVALSFADTIEQQWRQPPVVVVTLAFFGVALWIADCFGKGHLSYRQLSWRHGLLIGLAQAMALVPGVSRSGVTITAALVIGLNRADAARFSFLLAIPVLTLATGGKLLALLGGADTGVNGVAPLVAGVLFAFVSGYLCIKYFLRFLQTRSLMVFCLYRLLLSLAVFWLLVY